MVKATGANILPSKPSKVRSGKKTKMIITIPEATGVATSCAAWAIRSTTVRCLPACANWVSTFSTTTTAASTNMPIAMERPPKLIRFALRPKRRIKIKVAKADSGNIKATTLAARALPKKARSKITTNTMASNKACATVLIARSTKSLRW